MTTYYTVERLCATIGSRNVSAWHRLTYRREWIEERQLWRDTLVEALTISK